MRARRRRVLRVGTAADRGLLRRQQTREGLHRLGEHRHEFAALHVLGVAAHMRAFGADALRRHLRGSRARRPGGPRRFERRPGATPCCSSASPRARECRPEIARGRDRPASHGERRPRGPAPAAAAGQRRRPVQRPARLAPAARTRRRRVPCAGTRAGRREHCSLPRTRRGQWPRSRDPVRCCRGPCTDRLFEWFG